MTSLMVLELGKMLPKTRKSNKGFEQYAKGKMKLKRNYKKMNHTKPFYLDDFLRFIFLQYSK